MEGLELGIVIAWYNGLEKEHGIVRHIDDVEVEVCSLRTNRLTWVPLEEVIPVENQSIWFKVPIRD